MSDNIIKDLKEEEEVRDKYKCPKCGNTNIKKRNRLIHIFVPLTLCVIMFIGLIITADNEDHTVLGFILEITFFFAFIAIFPLLISAICGKNKCKSCSYKWR